MHPASTSCGRRVLFVSIFSQKEYRMKTKVNRLFLIGLLIILPMILLACAPVQPVSAQVIPPDLLDTILKIAIGFASLVGVSQLNTVLVQIGKLIGLVKDTTAAAWAAGLNIAFFGVLVYFGVFQPWVMVNVLDGYAAQLAEIALFVLGFVIQITGSKRAYDAIKASRVPLLSKSFSRA
jgi:hypothetical protein